MRIVLLILSIISICFSGDLLKKTILVEPGFKIRSFFVLYNTNTFDNNLYVFWDNNEKTRLKIYSSKLKVLKEIDNISNFVYPFQTVTTDSNFYFFSEILYIINRQKLKVDSIKLDRSDYRLASSYINLKLVTTYPEGIDIYDIPTFKKTQTIKRDEKLKYDNPKCFNNFILYRLKENEIGLYNIDSTYNIWKFNTGIVPGYFLGIKMGTFLNSCIVYKIGSEKSLNKYVYLATSFGDLYKLCLNSGSILYKKERFRGISNNAGLLTDISFMDLNFDGITDLICPSVDHNIYAINGKDFSLIWHCNTGNENQMPLSLHDINSDFIPDVFGVNDYDSKLSIIDGNSGKLIKGQVLSKKETFFQSYIILADFDGNCKLDLITKSSISTLSIFEFDSVYVQKNLVTWNPYK